MSDDSALPTYRLEDSVAVISLDDGKANVFSSAVVDHLEGLLDRAEADGARALVIVGRPGRFSAGFKGYVTNLPADVAALATGGRIAVIGVGAGAKAEVNLLALMGARGSICGSTLRARSLEDKADAARRVEHHVLGLLADRTVQVPIAATYAMTDAAAAYERFAAGNKFGKIILEDPT